MEIKVYGIAGNRLTSQIKYYLEKMRVTITFIDLGEETDLMRSFAERTEGNLKLVWVEVNGESRLVESVSAMCQWLNELLPEEATEPGISEGSPKA